MFYPPQPGRRLSIRQLEIVDLAAKGLDNVEIGEELHISGDTVKTHLYRAYRQSGAKNRAHLVAMVLSAGMIPKVPAPHSGAVSW